jgi:hypothetical protein
MTPALPLLVAANGEAAVATRFEWGRIQSNADWIAPIAVLLILLLVVRALYRRDAAELPWGLGLMLTALRAAALVGLLLLYLQPQWRSEREVVQPSRVLLLVDTSMSMNRVDGERGAGGSGASRIQQVAAALDEGDFLARLRKTHEVGVFCFDNALDRGRAVVLKKLPSPAPPPAADAEPAVSWRSRLVPRGTETRLGEALEQLIRDERSAPLAGVVLVSDGGQNAGAGPETAVEMAREARVPVFTVGIGSERRPTSVGVYDFRVPARAYPGDRYTVSGLIQAHGMAGQTVRVELLAREDAAAADPRQRGSGQRLAAKSVILGGDGEVVPVQFELTPEKTGRRTLCLRVQPPPGDRDPQEKYREAEVEIVDHKNHVLLLASGPTRDYQFLRALLYRDHSTTVDVLLQGAPPGISQEAAKILDDFPARREEMYAYDCVVAFDPNWQALRPGQVELLESWVGDQGGGLIAVAGAAYAGRATQSWLQAPEMGKIRSLYPVEFFRYFAGRGNTAYATAEPWPLEFTREGRDAEYLWLGETAVAAQQAWSTFPGVYGFCPVRGAKAGATVLARFSDPRTAQAGAGPVYFAEQFYGAGRVFFMGSGEMWRLRRVDPAYFEQFYTKLIRHVSQGRLLRQSARGALLVGQERYLVGSVVEVRAQLTNAKLEPLTLPSVPLAVTCNGLAEKPVALQLDASRAGSYLGQVPVPKEGEYRLELTVPESREERLSRSFHVAVPKLEEEHPQRNAALLSEIAAKTGGIYVANLAEAFAAGTPHALSDRLKDASRAEWIPVAQNPELEARWFRVWMTGLCAALCLEWLVRRMVKLA